MILLKCPQLQTVQICGKMGKNNGTFKYKAVQSEQRDESGFHIQPDSTEWLNGCECQIETYVPAKQKTGADGQVFTYTYDVFIPKHFKGVLELTAQMQLISEDGNMDEITVLGVDNFNRKYIEVWG